MFSVKSSSLTAGPQEVLLGLGVEEADGIPGVGVKSTDPRKTTRLSDHEYRQAR